MPLQLPSITGGEEFSEGGADGAVIGDNLQANLPPASPVTVQRKAAPATHGAAAESPAVSGSLLPPEGMTLQSESHEHHGNGEAHALSHERATRTKEIYTVASPSEMPMPLHSYASSGIEAAMDIIRETKTANNSHAVVSPASPLPTGQKAATMQRKAMPDSRVREMPRQGPSPIAGPMIWRNSGAAQMNVPASRPLLSGDAAIIQRFAESPTSSSSSSLSSDTPPATMRTKSGINMVQMAEDVSRLLARQLVIERERRGRSL